MRYNSLTLGLAALAPVALAQTTSECDPTKGDDCPPNPAFGNCRKEFVYDFTKVASGDGWKKDDGFRDLWKPDDGILGDDSPLSIDGTNGAVFTITKDDQAPLIKSQKYIFFGKVEVAVKAAPGRGIVTSIVLESDDRDEIDWEWVGADQGNVQTNFFSKGVNEYIHGETHPVGFNPMEGIHTYAIEWTPDFIVYSIDGQEIRRATPAEAENGAKWPQTPTFIKLGTWVGGRPGGSEGTIEWAGGLVDMSQAPFVGYYQSVKVTDYCGGRDQASEYVYGDASGSQASIKVEGSTRDEGFGDSGDDGDNDDQDEDGDDESEEQEDEDESSDSSSSTGASKPTSTSSADGTTGTDGSAQAEETEEPSAATAVQASGLAGVLALAFLVWA